MKKTHIFMSTDKKICMALYNKEIHMSINKLWESDKGQAEWEVEGDRCVWEAVLANHLEDWD